MPMPAASEKYKTLYWSIWNSRISLMKEKAPFWYILENGNIDLKLQSDKGGTVKPPYGGPIQKPTRFVENAQRIIAADLSTRHAMNYINAVEGITKDLVEQKTLLDEIISAQKTIDITIQTNTLLAQKTAEKEAEKAAKLEARKKYMENIALKKKELIDIFSRSAAKVKLYDKVKSKQVRADRLVLQLSLIFDRIILGLVPKEQRFFIGQTDYKRVRVSMGSVIKEYNQWLAESKIEKKILDKQQQLLQSEMAEIMTKLRNMI